MQRSYKNIGSFGAGDPEPFRKIFTAALILGFILSLWELIMLYQKTPWAPETVTSALFTVLTAFIIYFVILSVVTLVMHLPFWRSRRIYYKGFVFLPVVILSISITNRYAAKMEIPVPDPEISTWRNVLLVTLDTARHDYLSCYGHPGMKTPVLDGLSREGILFSDAVCPVPMTTPSHASMLTGTIPARHGAKENAYRLSDENITLAEVLVRLNYQTAAFVSCFPLDEKFHLDQGFITYDDEFMPHGGIYDLIWFRRLKRLFGSNRLERKADMLTPAVIRWLKRYHDRPFFLWVHFFDPHTPYVPPSPYDKMYKDEIRLPDSDDMMDENLERKIREVCRLKPQDRAYKALPLERYAGEMSFMDAMLGKIVNELERLQIRDNTIMAFCADHGESLGEHDYYYSHGRYLYEVSVKTPFIYISTVPDRKNIVWNAQTRLIDIPSIILNELGYNDFESFEGHNVLQEQSPEPAEELLPALIENKGIVLDPLAVKLHGLRYEDWKFIYSPEQSEITELYDLTRDPFELDNIAGEHPDRVESMKSATVNGFKNAENASVGTKIILDDETRDMMKALGYIEDDASSEETHEEPGD